MLSKAIYSGGYLVHVKVDSFKFGVSENDIVSKHKALSLGVKTGLVRL